MNDHSATGKQVGRLAMLAWLLSGAATLAACHEDTKCGGAYGGSDAAPVSGNADGGSDATPVSGVTFAVSLASTFCDSIAACCRQSGYDSSLCRSTLEPYLTAAFTVLLSDSRVALDEAGATRCLAAYRAALSACTDRGLARQIDYACSGALKGTVAMGGSCRASGDCLQPATGYAICVSGVCSPSSVNPLPAAESPRATVGQSCDGTCVGDEYSSSCGGSVHCWIQDGLYCGNGVCVVAPAVGQACAIGDYCEYSGHCKSGTCVADLATGPCTSDGDCLGTSYCDDSAKVCTPRKANGEICSFDRECSGGQCEQGRCRTWSMATPATCAGLLD
jgi:hypothetical protein